MKSPFNSLKSHIKSSLAFYKTAVYALNEDIIIMSHYLTTILNYCFRCKNLLKIKSLQNRCKRHFQKTRKPETLAITGFRAYDNL